MDLPWNDRNVVTPALLNKGVHAGTPTSSTGDIGGKLAASQASTSKSQPKPGSSEGWMYTPSGPRLM